jgi:adenylosuccinate lyase
MILQHATEVIIKNVKAVLSVLLELTVEYKNLVCAGRTHGQHALPTTYGMRFGVWAAEFGRHIDRLNETLPRIAVGKMSGAVGTMASFGEKGIQVQKKVMELLGIGSVLIANQVVQRDRYAELVGVLALIAGTIDKVARHLRALQRSEIAEAFEPFKKKQVGSSTMPQKRNPHKLERLSGLSRVIKSNVFIALENISLEDERDISNSGSERVMLPETFVLLDYMLVQLKNILSGLELNKENIARNLNLTDGAILSERIMIELVGKGVGRQEAHELLREAVIKARTEKISIRNVFNNQPTIKTKFTPQEVEEMLEPKNYIGTAVEQIEKLVDILSSKYK